MTPDELVRSVTRITEQEAREALAAITSQTDDDEEAHGNEDALHRRILLTIAQGCDDPARLAAIGLKTLFLDFSRWCA